METEDTGFGDLLEQAEQLTAAMDTTGELPRVERNLKQLMDVSQQLWHRTAQSAGAVGRESTDIKASVLLGSKGYSLPKISSKLESLSTSKSMEPLEPLPETDVEGFLRNEQENTIMSIIEETQNSAFAQADRQYWDSLLSDWERQKQKILSSFVGNIIQDAAGVTVGQQETNMNLINNLRRRSVMDHTEIAYAKEVYIYNEGIINGGTKPNIAEKFARVGQTLDDKNAMELWSMVNHMTNVPVCFGQDTLAMRTSPALQKAFVNQARSYLESVYIKYMKVTVYGNLEKAVLGGIPGTFHLVSSFLNIKSPSGVGGGQDGKVNGHPVWAMIYYCLRCGDLSAAMQVANAAGPSLDEFRPYLSEYVRDGERKLSARNETLIRVLYRRSVFGSTDPFKKAVFCIVGSCDIKEDHSEVADKIDDYLWLKLCQVTVDQPTESIPSDTLSHSQFQIKLLEDYGENHFRAYQQPLLYFQVLFLTTQFEAAIEFLSRIDEHRCHAVHVALVLFEAKMLNLPHSIHSPLIFKDPADLPPLRRLNFVRLVTLYTRKFEATDPREALQYFYFLRNLTGDKSENLLMSCISELVLETREFDMLLGILEADGCRRPGLIDKFGGDTQKMIEVVAADSENRGMLEDAVKLYDLAKCHEKVLDLLVKMLGNVASQASVKQSRRDRLYKMAVSVAERYKNVGNDASRLTTATFYLLLDVMTFFDLYHANKHQDALDVLRKLKLVPFQTEELEQYVASFREFADEIRRCLPDILLAAMSCLHALYASAKNTNIKVPIAGRYSVLEGDGGKDKYMKMLKKQAETFITFGGMVPYRMPGDTVARLVQKEILMI